MIPKLRSNLKGKKLILFAAKEAAAAALVTGAPKFVVALRPPYGIWLAASSHDLSIRPLRVPTEVNPADSRSKGKWLPIHCEGREGLPKSRS